jgi:hypothetical protein
MTRLPLFVLTVLSVLLVSGCGPTGTWSRNGATTEAHVYMAPAPQAIAKAIDWWIIREYGVAPERIDIAMVDPLGPAAMKVEALVVGSRIVSMDDPHAIRVEALRLSRSHASIDLNAPRKDLPRQLITIDMAKYGTSPWKVTGANWWRFNQKQITQVHQQLRDAAAAKAAAEESARAEPETQSAKNIEVTQVDEPTGNDGGS